MNQSLFSVNSLVLCGLIYQKRLIRQGPANRQKNYLIVGYLTLLIPFITAVADRLFNKPWYPKGDYSFRTHMAEGGIPDVDKASWRKNPFDQNGFQDPFYHGASWLPKP